MDRSNEMDNTCKIMHVLNSHNVYLEILIGAIWDIVDHLREIPIQKHNVDRAIIHDIVKYVGSLNSIVDKVGTLHAKIHPLQ